MRGSTMTILLHVTGMDRAAWLAAIKAQAPRLEVISAADTDRFAEIRRAWVWKPPAGLLGQLPNLELIINLAAGVDAILADATVPKHLPILRAVDPNITMRMTEWVVLQVLFHHRQMPAFMDQQKQRVWRELPQKAASALTVGILGMGVLGQSAARALAGLGFKVIGWSRTGAQPLSAFLSQTDILVCLLPFTPETKGLISYELLRQLNRGGPLGAPVLINGGRGGSQIGADVLRALNDGTLGGASLDVFETEPLPEGSPFWSHPKVIVTPHVAAYSDPEAMTAHVLEQLARHEVGGTMAPLVDRARGY